MPRNNDVYSPPPGTGGTPQTPISSAMFNAYVADITADLNAARPIVVGGTGASTAQGALDAFFTGSTTVRDDRLVVVDPSDATKRVRLDAGSVTAGQTRVLTMPDANLDLSGLATQAEGDILYRGATAWQRLAKGNPGEYLRQHASDSKPTWGRVDGWEPIGSYSAASVASFILPDLAAYRMLRVSGFLIPATDGTNILCRLSSNNGASFDIGGSDYAYTYHRYTGATETAASASTSAFTINNVINVGNVSASEGMQVDMLFSEMNVAARNTKVIWDAGWQNDAGSNNGISAIGFRSAAALNNAIQFIAASGNLSYWLAVEGIRG